MWRTALMQTVIYRCRQSLCSLAALFGFGLACGATAAVEAQTMSTDAPSAQDTSELEAADVGGDGRQQLLPVLKETQSRVATGRVATDPGHAPILDTEPVADVVMPPPQLRVPVAATGFAFSALSVAAGVSVSWLALFVATLMILRPR